MKHILIALVPSLFLACNPRVTKPGSDRQVAGEAASLETAAADSLYIDDMVDSAAEGSGDAAGEDDESAKEDAKPSRLEKMAADLIEELDSDGSKTLSEAEYLGILDQKIEDKNLPEERVAKVTEKLKAEFVKFAGSDSILTSEELQALLKGQAERVGKYRCKKHKNKHKDRVKEVSEEILAKYDKNGDKKIDAAEAKDIISDKKKCHGKKNKGKNKGDEGKGTDGGKGDDASGENTGGKGKGTDGGKGNDAGGENTGDEGKGTDGGDDAGDDDEVIVIPPSAGGKGKS